MALERPVGPEAGVPRSTTTTFTPREARWYAAEAPCTPAPTIPTSNAVSLMPVGSTIPVAGVAARGGRIPYVLPRETQDAEEHRRDRPLLRRARRHRDDPAGHVALRHDRDERLVEAFLNPRRWPEPGPRPTRSGESRWTPRSTGGPRPSALSTTSRSATRRAIACRSRSSTRWGC